MKKKLNIQNDQIQSEEYSKKTVKKSIKFRVRIFKLLFKAIEMLWILIQIAQAIAQFFR